MNIARIAWITALVLLLTSFPALAQTPGSEKWSVDPGADIKESPALGADGVIYVGAGETLRAFNPDGTTRWTAALEGKALSSPAIDSGGVIYIGTDGKTVEAVHPDGSKKWTFSTGGKFYSTPAIGGDGVIYVGCYDAKFYAITPDGAKKWEYETGGGVISSPALDSSGVIYFGSNDGNIYALNADGTLKWIYETRGDVRSSPAIGPDGVIYVGSDNHSLYALNPNGEKKWSRDLDSEVRSSPAIGADGTIYVGSVYHNGGFFAINPDGTEKWEKSTGDVSYSSPSVGANGVIYIGNWNDKYLQAIDPDGTTLWTFTTGSYIHSSPLISPDGVIYLTSMKLYAIYSDSLGLAASVWPTFHGNNQNTGVEKNLPLTISDAIAFQVFTPGETIRKTLAVSNPESREIVINGDTCDNAYFRMGSSLPLTLAAGASGTMIVEILPDETARYNGVCWFTHDVDGKTVTSAAEITQALFLDDGGERGITARRALDAYTRCLAQNSGSPATKNNQAILHRLLGEADVAETLLLEALSESLNDNHGYAGIKMNLGVLKSDQGVPGEASWYYNLADADVAENLAKSTLAPLIYYNKGWQSYKEGRFSAASVDLDLVVAHSSANDLLKAKAHVLLGASYYQQGQTTAAQTAFQQAVDLDPDGPVGELARRNLSPPDCLTLEDGLGLTIRADLNGEELNFRLVYSTESHDPPGLYWKLDLATLQVNPTPSEGCLKFDENLALPVCIDSGGALYEFTLRFHPGADGGQGFYWKLDLGTLTEK